ncbi:MAG: Nif11-like leader peptide family RiPP precursor [Thermoclostridium sp.]|nr:Nif11-like leader peptide family RiPP precursor [Thermoclostridium sp.]
MSVENLKAFGMKVVEDKELNRKAREAGLNNIEGMIALAKEYGYDISMQDFIDIAKDMESADELSDDELEQVSGGISPVAGAVGANGLLVVASCNALGAATVVAMVSPPAMGGL